MRLLLLMLTICTPLAAQNTHAIRAAIDIGSSGPKLRVAEVDPTTNKIVKILHTKRYVVFFQENYPRTYEISPEAMHHGLSAIEDAIAAAKSYQTDGIAIVGASIFRTAPNGEQFADRIHAKTGLKVHLLDQELEGKLAFQAAQAKMDVEPEDLIVWDIGSSTQISGTTPEGFYLIDASHEGSRAFRDFIIESIQSRDLKQHKSPNPFSSEHASLAEAHARSLFAKIDQVYKEKIQQPTTQIVGVGSAFSNGIAPLMAGKNPFTIDDLASTITSLIGKTDEDLGGTEFASVEVSNALLVLGFMKELDIPQMSIVDVNNADGAMVYEDFWE